MESCVISNIGVFTKYSRIERQKGNFYKILFNIVSTGYNKNISPKIFDYIITFVNSQQYNSNAKWFGLKALSL